MKANQLEVGFHSYSTYEEGFHSFKMDNYLKIVVKFLENFCKTNEYDKLLFYQKCKQPLRSTEFRGGVPYPRHGSRS